MRCPTCKKEFHPQPDNLNTYCLDSNSNDVCCFSVQRCPSCWEVIVVREVGSGCYTDSGRYVMTQAYSEEVIYPICENISVAPEVPDEYRNDFLEATTVLSYSPKASAALSRRILQKVLREVVGIKKRDLSQEIDEFISTAQAPSYLVDAVDAIRHIGNFAAHPIKYANTGEIVEVEDGEAEWLLEVLDALFDFAFVQPIKLAKRRQTLNEKLKEANKPSLKGK